MSWEEEVRLVAAGGRGGDARRPRDLDRIENAAGFREITFGFSE